MKIFSISSSYPLAIALLYTLLLFTTNVTGIADSIPMTTEQITILLEDGWRICCCSGSSMGKTPITTHGGEDFYISGHVSLNLEKDVEKKIRDVYPVGLHVYADIFKDDVELSYGYGDVNRTGAYKIKIRAPHETGYYKINVYSSNISKSKYYRKLISYSGTVYVKPTDSDGDGWIDAHERRAGTDIYKKDTDNDGYWDPQDSNPLDSTIPPSKEVSGFEAIFAIIGLSVVVYLLRIND